MNEDLELLRLKVELADHEEYLRLDLQALVNAQRWVVDSIKRRNEAAKALADYQKNL
jgi:hypothetical protein